jgi:ribosomal protein L40E
MPLIEAKGRPHLFCAKCKTVLVLPDSLDSRERQELAHLRRTDVMSAIKHLTQHHALHLREAKAIASHIPPAADLCTRCHAPIPRGDTTCPKCRSVNLNW